MNKAIEQTIRFDNAAPEELFGIFMDAELHSKIIGADVAISARQGAKFSCFNGHVTGKNLLIVPGKIIVQSWRGDVWTKNDPDSILILVFSAVKNGAVIYLVHANTPDQFTERWNEFYWKPMKQYLKAGKK